MILGLLQARLSSQRLPKKVLRPIMGRPMLALQLERVRRSRLIDKLIVATSTESSDDPIAALCVAEGIACFRGSLVDVLDRFYHAAKSHAPAAVVRLTGDCPLADPHVIDATIDFFLSGAYDFVSNCQPPYTFPDGLDVAVIRYHALETAWREACTRHEREHVTPFIKFHSQRFRLGHYSRYPSLGHHRWTVDEVEDFELITNIYTVLYPSNPLFVTTDILQLLAAHPEWFHLNRQYGRNAGSKSSH
jgi:spore coat polysaccharide biosynthesis protein SpsF (cytidylyltransferase family)